MNLKVCTRAGFASGLQTVQVSYILLNNDYSSGTISAVGRAFDSMLEVLGSIPGSVKGVLVTYFLPHGDLFFARPWAAAWPGHRRPTAPGPVVIKPRPNIVQTNVKPSS